MLLHRPVPVRLFKKPLSPWNVAVVADPPRSRLTRPSRQWRHCRQITFILTYNNPTAYSTAWSREASLNTIPATDATKYACATSGQSDFFSGQQTFDGDNAMPKDRPRLKRTTKLNATIVFVHTAIIKSHSR